MGGLALIINLCKWRKVRATRTEFKGLVEHFRFKRKADIRDHPIVEIDQQLFVSIRADAFRTEVFTVARIYHVVHLFPSPPIEVVQIALDDIDDSTTANQISKKHRSK